MNTPTLVPGGNLFDKIASLSEHSGQNGIIFVLYVYLDFEHRVSKDKDPFYYLAIKNKIKGLHLTPVSKLMVPGSIPAGRSLKRHKF